MQNLITSFSLSHNTFYIHELQFFFKLKKKKKNHPFVINQLMLMLFHLYI